MASWLVRIPMGRGLYKVIHVESGDAPIVEGADAIEQAHCEECADLIANYGLTRGQAQDFAHGSDDARFAVFLRG